MRRFEQRWDRSPVVVSAQNAFRRWTWFIGGATLRQLANLATSVIRFALRRPTSGRVPVMIKLDISPVCNLSCSFCVHSSADDDALREQHFSSAHRIDVDRFRRIVDEIGGRTSMLALYYVGDPLVHPHLPEMCRIARAGRIRTHVSTNFSFRLSDERLRSLATSGLSHLTVCVDSMVQEEYEKTRVGGDIELVLSNLQRLMAIRRELGITDLHVEVQYIRFRHNERHVAAAETWAAEHGIDQFTTYWGNLHNYVDLAPDQITVTAPRTRSWVPHCAWPYFAMTVRYDGEAIPCCYHRVSEQYRIGGDDRPVANVFERSIESVWRSDDYARLRRMVANPAGQNAVERESSFCHGCSAIEHTDTSTIERRADRHEWEPVNLGRPAP